MHHGLLPSPSMPQVGDRVRINQYLIDVAYDDGLSPLYDLAHWLVRSKAHAASAQAGLASGTAGGPCRATIVDVAAGPGDCTAVATIRVDNGYPELVKLGVPKQGRCKKEMCALFYD